MKQFPPKIILSVLLFLQAEAIAQSAAVPLYHSIYPFLERLTVYLPHRALDLHVIPIDRAQTLEILKEAEKSDLPLSKADRALLAQYLAEFEDPKLGEPAVPGSERHFLRHEEKNAQIFLDAFALQQFEIRRGDWQEPGREISRTRAGGRMRASLPPRFMVALDISNILERGTGDTLEIVQPGSGTPIVLSGRSAFREAAIAYARLKLPWLEIEAGRNQFSWNVSPFTNLALSRENEPFDLVRFDARWSRFRFVYTHADLRASRRKFLAAHRLEIMPFSRFLFAVGETVVYGDRGAEFQYLNPLMLYHAAEHLLGDKDNNVLTLDFSYFPFPKTKFYGEIYIDDLSLEYPIGTYFGNKLGYLAGAFWVQPLGWRTGDLRLEYARVDPYVYTHELPQNVYEQDGEALGARLGPNADRYLLALEFQPHRDLRLNTNWRFERKGRGDLFTPHHAEDSNAKGFLQGTLIRTFAWHLAIENQIRRDIYAGLEFDWERVENAEFVSGSRQNRRQAAFTLRIDY